MSHLGTFLRSQRVQRGLSLGALAKLVGYRNISKGVKRLTRLECDGTSKDDLLVSVVEALGVELPVAERLLEQDRQEHLLAWEAWVSEPVLMQLIVRYMAAVYGRVKLPEDITTPEQAEAWACDYAKKHRLRVCLAISRRVSVWIDADGQVESRTEARPDQPNQPWMDVKGRKFLFPVEPKQVKADSSEAAPQTN